jgi:hypothetical protein
LYFSTALRQDYDDKLLKRHQTPYFNNFIHNLKQTKIFAIRSKWLKNGTSALLWPSVENTEQEHCRRFSHQVNMERSANTTRKDDATSHI